MVKERIIGFDLARAYALFGMFIVNFNYCFGSVFQTTDPAGRFLNLFTGNSTSIFIILAGMGLSLLSKQKNDENISSKQALRSVILKRSWFLLALGLLLFNWWPGDILHFYGSYMHFAAFLLFVPKRYYLWSALAVVVIYHILLFIIPVTTGWDMATFRYNDFWTVSGFLRNTFYNGWNSVFPWIAYFLLGMWLGKLDWDNKKIRRAVFISGSIVFVVFELLRFVTQSYFSSLALDYVMSEYFPPYFPFMAITAGFALMVISICMFMGEYFQNNKIITWLVKTGQMTLSHYVIHLTLGMILLQFLTGKQYTGFPEDEVPTAPLYILFFAIAFFIVSILFSILWSKRFKNGPLELLMRKISG